MTRETERHVLNLAAYVGAAIVFVAAGINDKGVMVYIDCFGGGFLARCAITSAIRLLLRIRSKPAPAGDAGIQLEN